MTVALSDHDYGLLVQAVGWIEYHSGVDAPHYPALDRLSSVVNCIAKRREPEIPHKSQLAFSGNVRHIRLGGTGDPTRLPPAGRRVHPTTAASTGKPEPGSASAIGVSDPDR